MVRRMSENPAPQQPRRDKPWVMRTYAGHSSASESNALYRRNLAKGQTGLSVAFDLPTQTGYDPDSALAKGEVGKVGVPVPHLGEMRRLFDGIPLTEMNTSMTINATAMWLLALYQVVAEEQAGATTAGGDRACPRPAGRDDAERHHQGVPLPRHLRLPARALPAAHHRHHRLHGRLHRRSGVSSACTMQYWSSASFLASVLRMRRAILSWAARSRAASGSRRALMRATSRLRPGRGRSSAGRRGRARSAARW